MTLRPNIHTHTPNPRPTFHNAKSAIHPATSTHGHTKNIIPHESAAAAGHAKLKVENFCFNAWEANVRHRSYIVRTAAFCFASRKESFLEIGICADSHNMKCKCSYWILAKEKH